MHELDRYEKGEYLPRTWAGISSLKKSHRDPQIWRGKRRTSVDGLGYDSSWRHSVSPIGPTGPRDGMIALDWRLPPSCCQCKRPSIHGRREGAATTTAGEVGRPLGARPGPLRPNPERLTARRWPRAPHCRGLGTARAPDALVPALHPPWGRGMGELRPARSVRPKSPLMLTASSPGHSRPCPESGLPTMSDMQ